MSFSCDVELVGSQFKQNLDYFGKKSRFGEFLGIMMINLPNFKGKIFICSDVRLQEKLCLSMPHMYYTLNDTSECL